MSSSFLQGLLGVWCSCVWRAYPEIQ